MVNNLSIVDFVTYLPPELVSKVENLVFILKAIGVIFIGYIIFLVVKGILSVIRGRKIDKIYKKVHEIEKKLDKVLEGKKHKEDVSKEIHKKTKKDRTEKKKK